MPFCWMIRVFRVEKRDPFFFLFGFSMFLGGSRVAWSAAVVSSSPRPNPSRRRPGGVAESLEVVGHQVGDDARRPGRVEGVQQLARGRVVLRFGRLIAVLLLMLGAPQNPSAGAKSAGRTP